MENIQDTLRPILTSMKILGLYHDITDTNSIGPSPTLNVQGKSRNWRKILNSGTYSLVVALLLWTNFVRACVALLPVDPGFASRAVYLAWFLQCATNATVMYFACHKRTFLPAFMKHWNGLFDDCLTSNASCSRRFSKRYVVAATAIAWVSYMFNSVGVLYLMDSNLEEARFFRINAIKPFPESIASLVVCSVLHVIESGAWLFPVAFVVTTSYTIKLNFDCLSNAFEKYTAETDSDSLKNLHWFRTRHLNMCKAVTILDRVFMFLMAVNFGSNILLCCFVLYDIVNTPMAPLYLTLNIFWLVACTCAMMTTALSSAQVNEAAHAPLDHIYRIQTKAATVSDFSQLHLFLSKLTGTTVGFTIMNMIVVTKETILTIAGVFITYFFLLLQFKIT